jgi:hypothetical protein
MSFPSALRATCNEYDGVPMALEKHILIRGMVIRASLLLLFNFLFYKPLCLGYTKIATDETSHSVPASPKASSVQQYVFFASIVPVPHHNVSPLSVPLLKDQNKN